MKRVVRDLECFDALPVQVPRGRHRATELIRHLGRSFPRTSSLEPVVFPSIVAFILTRDDLPREALEVVGALTVQGVLHGILCSKLLQREVGEVIDVVEDPECNQVRHHIRVELREADVQI